MTDRLDLPSRYRKAVEALLREHVPDAEVWAYGSRVNGMSHPGSDLDLVLRSPTLEQLGDGYHDLVEAFQESNIPILIQAHDWARLPESFHREIERDYVVVQEGTEQPVPGEWREVTLGNLIDIKHGFAFKGSSIHDDPQGDILLTPGNFAIGGGFKGDKIKYYDGHIPEEFVLGEGDLLVSMTDLSKQSDTLGYPALVPSRPDVRRYLHNQRLGKISLKRTGEAFARYLYYILCSTEYRSEVLASATGTTVKHTSPERIKQFRFILPPLPEQRAIAHILGTLDDKIELNRRMNETLEEMARALFQSWFVDFDPVRAKMEGRDTGLPPDLAALFPDRLVDSEVGEIPEGWQVRALGDVLEQRVERCRPSPETKAIPYVPIDCISPRSLSLTSSKSGDAAQSSLTRFYRGDLLFGAMRPYFHKVCIAPFDGTTRTTAFVLYPKFDYDFSFGTCLLHNPSTIDFATRNATGSTIPYAVWADSLELMPTIMPPIPIRKAFHAVVQAVLHRFPETYFETQALTTLRDSLLPRLVSGEVRVEAERVMEVTN